MTAFLLMDHWHRGFCAEANLALNRYLDACDDEDRLPLISFLMALRAAVPAHRAATQAQGEAAAARHKEAHSYFARAQALLRTRPTKLIGIGGLSGSGRSTGLPALAPEIGPALGARILASGRIRTHLFEVPAETQLPTDAYRPDISEKACAQLAAWAARVTGRGHAVVADADPDKLLQRIRSRTCDVSDAAPGVLASPLTHCLGTIEWTHTRADADTRTVCKSTLEAIGAAPGNHEGDCHLPKSGFAKKDPANGFERT